MVSGVVIFPWNTILLSTMLLVVTNALFRDVYRYSSNALCSNSTKQSIGSQLRDALPFAKQMVAKVPNRCALPYLFFKPLRTKGSFQIRQT
jgi:hypothetical protein